MTRVIIQKHCEVLDVNPDPKEKDTYDIKVLLTKGMEEFVPEIPIKLKGSSQEIAKILSFLGKNLIEAMSSNMISTIFPSLLLLLK